MKEKNVKKTKQKLTPRLSSLMHLYYYSDEQLISQG